MSERPGDHQTTPTTTGNSTTTTSNDTNDKQQYFAVRRGRHGLRDCIFLNWEQCKPFVEPKERGEAIEFSVFNNWEAAEEYIGSNQQRNNNSSTISDEKKENDQEETVSMEQEVQNHICKSNGEKNGQKTKRKPISVLGRPLKKMRVALVSPNNGSNAATTTGDQKSMKKSLKSITAATKPKRIFQLPSFSKNDANRISPEAAKNSKELPRKKSAQTLPLAAKVAKDAALPLAVTSTKDRACKTIVEDTSDSAAKITKDEALPLAAASTKDIACKTIVEEIVDSAANITKDEALSLSAISTKDRARKTIAKDTNDTAFDMAAPLHVHLAQAYHDNLPKAWRSRHLGLYLTRRDQPREPALKQYLQDLFELQEYREQTSPSGRCSLPPPPKSSSDSTTTTTQTDAPTKTAATTNNNDDNNNGSNTPVFSHNTTPNRNPQQRHISGTTHPLSVFYLNWSWGVSNSYHRDIRRQQTKKQQKLKEQQPPGGKTVASTMDTDDPPPETATSAKTNPNCTKRGPLRRFASDSLYYNVELPHFKVHPPPKAKAANNDNHNIDDDSNSNNNADNPSAECSSAAVPDSGTAKLATASTNVDADKKLPPTSSSASATSTTLCMASAVSSSGNGEPQNNNTTKKKANSTFLNPKGNGTAAQSSKTKTTKNKTATTMASRRPSSSSGSGSSYVTRANIVLVLEQAYLGFRERGWRASDLLSEEEENYEELKMDQYEQDVTDLSAFMNVSTNNEEVSQEDKKATHQLPEEAMKYERSSPTDLPEVPHHLSGVDTPFSLNYLKWAWAINVEDESETDTGKGNVNVDASKAADRDTDNKYDMIRVGGESEDSDRYCPPLMDRFKRSWLKNLDKGWRASELGFPTGLSNNRVFQSEGPFSRKQREVLYLNDLKMLKEFWIARPSSQHLLLKLPEPGAVVNVPKHKSGINAPWSLTYLNWSWGVSNSYNRDLVRKEKRKEDRIMKELVAEARNGTKDTNKDDSKGDSKDDSANSNVVDVAKPSNKDDNAEKKDSRVNNNSADAPN